MTSPSSGSFDQLQAKPASARTTSAIDRLAPPGKDGVTGSDRLAGETRRPVQHSHPPAGGWPPRRADSVSVPLPLDPPQDLKLGKDDRLLHRDRRRQSLVMTLHDRALRARLESSAIVVRVHRMRAGGQARVT